VTTPGNAETEAHRLDKAKAENGVVTLAGLLFQQCSSGQESQLNVCTGTAVSMNHFRAQDYCERLALGNRRWRLPTRAELETLLLKDRPYIPLTDPTVFPATAAQAYWTASDFHGSDHSYWVVDFQRGKSVGKDIFKSAYVRCVTGK
jgi:hypothetical protein